MYNYTTALISDAQPLLAVQVLQLQLITGYVLLLTKSLLTADCVERDSSGQNQSESESLYNWRLVSQYVLVSSPIWDF
jgi:hypothetical protein